MKLHWEYVFFLFINCSKIDLLEKTEQVLDFLINWKEAIKERER